MNKNGWGLRVELMFIIIFLVCLLIATIGLKRMGMFGGDTSYEKPDDNFSYVKLENSLNEASKRYYQNHYEDSTTEVTIMSSTLISNGYISILKDENGRVCSGYTKVLSNYSGGLVFTSYINCPNYKTVGYTYE